MGVTTEEKNVQVWKKERQLALKACSLSEDGGQKFNDRTEVLHQTANLYSNKIMERADRLFNREITIGAKVDEIAVKVASRHKKNDHNLTDWELRQLRKIRKLDNGLKIVKAVETIVLKDLLDFSGSLETVTEFELDRLLALEAPEEPKREGTMTTNITDGLHNVPTNGTDGSNAVVGSTAQMHGDEQVSFNVSEEPEMGDQN